MHNGFRPAPAFLTAHTYTWTCSWAWDLLNSPSIFMASTSEGTAGLWACRLRKNLHLTLRWDLLSIYFSDLLPEGKTKHAGLISCLAAHADMFSHAFLPTSGLQHLSPSCQPHGGGRADILLALPQKINICRWRTAGGLNGDASTAACSALRDGGRGLMLPGADQATWFDTLCHTAAFGTDCGGHSRSRHN